MSHLSSINIRKNIQQALEVSKLKEIVLEEIKASKKNET